MPDRRSAEPPPAPPRKPDNDECCHSGCERCVLELYQEELERYRAALQAWEEKNRANPSS